MGGDAQMQGGLVPCDICGRNFAANRIEAHMRACAAGGAKPRRVFNAAQQRIGAIEGVTQGQLRAANQEATEKAKAAAAQRMQPPAAKQRSVERSVMLGKDGRPLSPLSAAMARAKAGEDPYDEDPNDIPSDIRPCPCCGRNFAKDRLPKHLEICQKITVNSQQRQTWNSQSQRLTNGQTFGGISGSPPPVRSSLSRRGGAGGTFRATNTPGNGERAPSRSSQAESLVNGVRSLGSIGFEELTRDALEQSQAQFKALVEGFMESAPKPKRAKKKRKKAKLAKESTSES